MKYTRDKRRLEDTVRTGNARRPVALLCCILGLWLGGGQAAESGAAHVPPVSPPPGESQILRLRLSSEIMGNKVPYWVYLPEGYENGSAYPVWYGLHSYSASESMWSAGEHIDQIAEEMIAAGELAPLIMVFPFVRYDTAKEIKADMEDGVRGESKSAQFVWQELVPAIDQAFSTDPRPEGRFIGGFSMGGLFALEIGLRHPGLFGVIGAYSPALTWRDYTGDALLRWLFPADPDGDGSAGRRFDGLKVQLAWGENGDPFSEGTESLARALSALGAKVAASPHEGGHSLPRNQLKEYLMFYQSR